MELNLDRELEDRLSKRATHLGFESTEEYCEVILQTVIDEIESEGSGQDRVEDRLEDLGYLG